MSPINAVTNGMQWYAQGIFSANLSVIVSPHSVMIRACSLNWSSETTWRVSSCVDSRRTGHDSPMSAALFHVLAQTHHLSPGTSPGKLYCGAGVIRSFPLDLAKSRNSAVTWQHTVCRDLSFLSVLQHPSLNHPVNGDSEHDSSSVPRTLKEGSMIAGGKVRS